MIGGGLSQISQLLGESKRGRGQGPLRQQRWQVPGGRDQREQLHPADAAQDQQCQAQGLWNIRLSFL